MKLPELPKEFNKVYETIKIDLPGGFTFEPSYLTAGAIVLLIFLLILTLGQLRHRFLDWHIKGFLPGILFGVILTLIVEGFALVGGHTIITSVLGWKNAPKPLSVALDSGRKELADVLGVKEISFPEGECKAQVKIERQDDEEPTSKSVLSDFFTLDIEGKEIIQNQICNE